MNRDVSPGQNSVMSNCRLSPQEEALQSLCKQLLKSRIFRGRYEQRLYVETVDSYRDVVGLHRSDRDLEKMLMDIKRRLQIFYQHSPDMWIGVTQGALTKKGSREEGRNIDTYVWVELENVAFGQYWFSIKSIRFREREILLKLKMLRPMDDGMAMEPCRVIYKTEASLKLSSMTCASSTTVQNVVAAGTIQQENKEATQVAVQVPSEHKIGLRDFVNILQDWGETIKRAVYDFMSNDINKENIKGLLQFVGLLVISLLSGSVLAVKYFGMFLLRFMFEFSRFTHTMTPIVLKIIDVFSKIVGGFYILLAMMWKDAVVNRNQKQPPPQPQLPFAYGDSRAIEYNRPLYKTTVLTGRHSKSPMSTRYTDFERRSQ